MTHLRALVADQLPAAVVVDAANEAEDARAVRRMATLAILELLLLLAHRLLDAAFHRLEVQARFPRLGRLCILLMLAMTM
eukprot:15460239-Alexandrium_andersonii.AAC.1